MASLKEHDLQTQCESRKQSYLYIFGFYPNSHNATKNLNLNSGLFSVTLKTEASPAVFIQLFKADLHILSQ